MLFASIKIDTEANAAETSGLNLSFVRGLVVRAESEILRFVS